MENDWKSCIELCSIPNIGAVGAMRLIKRFGGAAKALKASKAELMSVEKIGEKIADSIIENRGKTDIAAVETRMNELGARYIQHAGADYPKLLEKISDPPVGLYVIGDCDFNAPCISIIGSRICTVYGRLAARRFAAAFARAGFTVVSGMARGIDSEAHYGALEAGGKTIAVLGCGADVVYPPENEELYGKIIKSGAAVSEFPLGSRADKQNFPIRNRIVSGLSLATLVIESDIRGGSMITARLAAEQGRDVFALPGRIDQPSSRGCNALIRDGVTLATCPEDILDSLSFSGQIEIDFSAAAPSKDAKCAGEEKKSAPQIKLDGDEAAIFALLSSEGELAADAVSERSGLPVSQCLSALLMLEIKKLVAKGAGGMWRRR